MLTCLINGKPNNLIDSEYTKEDWKKWAAKGIVLCPVCKKPYEYCHGRIRIPYFRHKDKQECLDVYSELETQEHLQGKTDIYNWLKTVDGITDLTLEAWLPNTKQRPDIYFKYRGKEYVIEYQCSPISSEYIERHELYEASGIIDIWICGCVNYWQCYHNGRGAKRTNIVEKTYGLYYNVERSMLAVLDPNATWKQLCSGKTEVIKGFAILSPEKKWMRFDSNFKNNFAVFYKKLDLKYLIKNFR